MARSRTSDDATVAGPSSTAPSNIALPPEPFQARPSFPVSMILKPERVADSMADRPAEQFSGELSEDFDAALKRVERASGYPRRRRSWVARWLRLRSNRRDDSEVNRRVAFDGFRNPLYDDKSERDRRYGTVYTVEERANAYLIRLEMPRLLPASALESIWELGDNMPDYDYKLTLGLDFLRVKGSTSGEALRRLSYISGSFPADFTTQIDFAQATGGLVHRLRDKVLEIIVFKQEDQAGLEE